MRVEEWEVPTGPLGEGRGDPRASRAPKSSSRAAKGPPRVAKSGPRAAKLGQEGPKSGPIEEWPRADQEQPTLVIGILNPRWQNLRFTSKGSAA